MEERETRRKRIAERGSDRLALITGRVHTLDQPATSSFPSPTSITSCHSDHALLPPLPNGNPTHFRHRTEGDVPATSATEQNINSKFTRGNAFKYRGNTELQIPKLDTNVETKTEEQPLVLTPKPPKTTSDDKKPINPKQINSFSAKEINSCIVATESVRIFCSVAIALLVVLSNTNFPIIKATSTIASRPIYILLLSNVTVVVLKLMQRRKDTDKVDEEMKIGPLKDGPNWDGAVQILEIGVVLYQSVRALFIDISFYMVVVICGLCLI